jgi:hypothetical protein
VVTSLVGVCYFRYFFASQLCCGLCFVVGVRFLGFVFWAW